MAHAASDRRPHVIVDGYDEIEVASIDSVPASHPPGWIETKAKPCADPAAAPASPRTPRRRGAKQRK